MNSGRIFTEPRGGEVNILPLFTEIEKYNYWVASWQTQSRSAFSLFVFFFLVFFSVSVKVLPVTPLVSGVFVDRAFCEYFLKIERVVELRRFLWWTQ